MQSGGAAALPGSITDTLQILPLASDLLLRKDQPTVVAAGETVMPKLEFCLLPFTWWDGFHSLQVASSVGTESQAHLPELPRLSGSSWKEGQGAGPLLLLSPLALSLCCLTTPASPAKTGTTVSKAHPPCPHCEDCWPGLLATFQGQETETERGGHALLVEVQLHPGILCTVLVTLNLECKSYIRLSFKMQILGPSSPEKIKSNFSGA